MALPTLKRNWVFTRSGGSSTLNQIIPAQTIQLDSNGYKYQQALVYWYLKDTLVNFSSGPWEVVQSRSASAWGNADYWTTPESLWTGGSVDGVHWIVLQNKFAGRTAQILIYWSGNMYGYAQISTGTLFPPSIGGNVPVTPSDAIRWDYFYYSLLSTHPLIYTGVYTGIFRLHVMQTWDSDQGVESLRFAAYNSGGRYLWGFWDKVENVPTGGTIWDYPEVAIIGPNDTYQPTWSHLGVNRSCHAIYGKLPGTVTPVGAYMVAQSLNQTDKIVPFIDSGYNNSLINEYEFLPISIAGDLNPMFGRFGDLVDFWLGSNAVGDGIGYPVGSPQFCQFGNIIWPWDSTQLPPQLT